MTIGEYLPFWGRLSTVQQQLLREQVTQRTFPKGALLHGGAVDCIGLLLPVSGQLRAYILSEEGKEITLYRLFAGDMCLFSASCIMRNIQFDVMISAQEDTVALHIPAEIYHGLMEESAAVANYTSELMAARFSEVMWLLDQVLNKKLDSRLAAFLLEESRRSGATLTITQEQIAHHLGSVREVVTRMLHYFQAEKLVRLNRGSLVLLDTAGLMRLADASLRAR
ncbi:MAG: Crp/Fnr family transcriptional regulator [Ruthenibacterium sp.]